MEAGTAENAKIVHLRHAVENVNSPSQRDKVLALFDVAAAKFPNAACGLLMRAIEKLLKQKMMPIAEINALFSFTTSRNGNASLEEILSANLPQRFSKLEYFLRVYTLRTLMSDKDLLVDRKVLRAIAGKRDVGRISVIDYIITRRSPNTDLLRLMELLISELDDKEGFSADSKRSNAVARLIKKFPPPREKLDLRTVTSHKKVLAEWDHLIRCEPSEILEWLIFLRQELESDCVPEAKLRSLSSSLTNLGSAFKDDPVVVDMWDLAIFMESKLSKPSSHIQQKLWRLCLAVKLHSASNFSGILLGLQLTFRSIGIPPPTETLTSGELKTLSSASSAVAQLPNWGELVDSLTGVCGYEMLICWFLMIVASSTGMRLPSEIANRLMELTSSCGLRTRLELEQAYCSLYGRCFDNTVLKAIVEHSSSTEERSISFALLAKSSSTQGDTLGAYQLCGKLTDASVPLVPSVLYELGFVGIASNLGCNDFPSVLIPLHKLNAQIDVAKEKSAKVLLVDLLVVAWLALANSGCYQDSARYLSSALHSAEQVLGKHSVRYIAISRLKTRFDQTLLLSCDEECASGSETSPAELGRAVEEISKFWLNGNSDIFSVSVSEYNELNARLSMDPVWSAFAMSAISSPSLVKSNNVCTDIELVARFKKVYHTAVSSDDPIWMRRMLIARRLLWLQLIGCNLNLHSELGGALSSPQSVARIQGEPIRSSRAFYSGRDIEAQQCSNLPGDTVCLCLNFDEEDVLNITRLERDSEPIALRLPAERWSELRTIEYDDDGSSYYKHGDAIKQIETIVEESTKVSTTNAREFWELQRELDSKLQQLVKDLQKVWIGGFSGIISAPAGGLQGNGDLAARLQSTFSPSLKYRRAKAAKLSWSINPVIVPLLRCALERNRADEIEDLVTSVLDSMKFHELPVAHDEINIWDLIKDIKAVFRSSTEPEKSPSERRRVLLVCDRKAAQIPWELFPVFKEIGSVTRALSLQQAEEWARLPRDIPTTGVSYLVNPDQDLPPTHKLFIQNFDQRGWSGLAGVKPKESEFAAQLQRSAGFIYVGHGSGKNYIRGSSLRKLYSTASPVFLFGCSSVRIKHPMLDDDALTEYSVMGSQLIMGTLWAVKDKDFNRFSHEFLSRVFDEKEPVGEALREARNACVLPHLTGGAAVVYGLP